jgi:hypothetical protein
MKNDKIFIRCENNPVEHALNAYKNAYYLEAIQIFHGWIEAKLREYLMMSRHGNIRRRYSDAWDIAEETGYNYLARALIIIEKISKNEYKGLQEFNSLRNKLVHKFFYDPYEKDYQGVSLKDYDRVFNKGIQISKKMEKRSVSVLHRRLKG